MSTTVVLFSIVVVLWLLQLVLAHLQARNFMRAVNELRVPGSTTAVGMAGKGWGRRRTYVALSAGADGRVRGARKLSGVTVWARPVALPSLEGRDLTELAIADGDGQAEAAAMAARTLLKAKDASAGAAGRGAEDSDR